MNKMGQIYKYVFSLIIILIGYFFLEDIIVAICMLFFGHILNDEAFLFATGILVESTRIIFAFLVLQTLSGRGYIYKQKTILKKGKISFLFAICICIITICFSCLSLIIETSNSNRPKVEDIIYIYDLVSIVVTPFAEELIFRSCFLTIAISEDIKKRNAIAMSAFVWSIFHYNSGIYFVIIIFLLGILYGWIFYTTRSIFFNVLSHVLFNLLAVFSHLYINTAEEITDAYGIYICIVGLSVIIIISVFLIHCLEKYIQKNNTKV